MYDRRQRETVATPSRRELSQRLSAGLEVVLYWHGCADAVTVSVRDARTGDEFELEVEGVDALDAFRHPYAYAAGCGVPRARPVADQPVADA